jgi:hypothetical protein
MSKFLKTIILSSLTIVGIFLIARDTKAATLSVTSEYEEVNFGETFIVEVRLNSERQVVNAVRAALVYPPEMLEVVDISRGGSFLTLWPQEPKNDADSGTITLAGGIPHGSYVVDGKVVSILFRTKSSGGLELSFDPAQTSVHLNDGLGTKTELKLNSGIYKVVPGVTIDITSPTHPDETRWYSNNNPVFVWQPEAEKVYSYLLSHDPTAIPDDLPDEAKAEITYEDLSDGIYYFIVKEKTSPNQWSLIGKRRVMIDTSPPLPVQGSITREATMFDNKYYLTFTSRDTSSGIDYYDVSEGGTTTTGASSPYVLEDQTRRSTIIVVAVDKAGNKTESLMAGSWPNPRLLMSSIYVIFGCLIVLLTFFILRILASRDQENKH